MTKVISNIFWYVLGFLLIFLALFAIFVQKTSAQSPSPNAGNAPSADITYPIEDLGGCKDVGSCVKYCDDPVNYTSCTQFAKEKGFYKDDPVVSADNAFWEKTKEDLGCDSQGSCMDFCTQDGNFAKCDEFSKKNGLTGGYTAEPDKPQYIEAAKEALGCDSLDSCAKVCSDSENANKCSDFASKVGLLGGNVETGPGGCTTEGTCQSYCSDPGNFGDCSKFAPNGSGFTGPGGCNSAETCRQYCEQNPNSCRSYSAGTNGVYVPVACGQNEFHGPQGACTPVEKTQEAANCAGSGKFWNGDGCQDNPPEGVTEKVPAAYFDARAEMGNCSTPGSCYDWCKENEGKCGNFDASGARSEDTYTPYVYYTPGTGVKFEAKTDYGNCDSPGSCYDWCKENEGKCGGFDAKSPRPLDTYVPGAYYTPPTDVVYITPPATSFYTTPMYFTPPAGSNYTTPNYYTPGSYSTPSYYTPPDGSNYVTPNYYTPGSNYYTPSGEYPTPNYPTPRYYTPPGISGYTTPYYYTPPTYYTPYYYTPNGGYTTPTYNTPPPYTTPVYYTPYTGGGYTTPVYYTPPVYSTPTYYTPPPGSTYTSPSYYTPPPPYTSPSYYTPGTYPTPPAYNTPPPYNTPSYYTPPPGSTYTSPTYYTPSAYTSPPAYQTPSYYSPSYYTPYYYTPSGNYTTPSYSTPSYYYPSPSGGYSYPSPSYASPSYYYPTPGSSYVYPSPSGSGTDYYTPNSSYAYPSPTDGYVTPSYTSPYVSPGGSYSYPTPGSYQYPSPSYSTPSYSYPSPSYATPSYSTPSYGTPTYNTPSYDTPPPYNTPSTYRGGVAGAKTQTGLIGWVKSVFSRFFGK